MDIHITAITIADGTATPLPLATLPYPPEPSCSGTQLNEEISYLSELRSKGSVSVLHIPVLMMCDYT